MNKSKVYIYPSLGPSFSMNRYLNGVLEGLVKNEIDYEVIKPQGNSLKAKYIGYPLLAWKERKKKGKHLIISERYSYLIPFIGKDNVVVCHDLHTLYPEAETPWIHRIIYRFFLAIMYKSDKVVCVSNHTKSDLIRYVPKFQRHPIVEVVYNGIEEFWESSHHEIVEEKAWTRLFEQKKVLLSVGTDAWYKNNEWSLRFLAELDDEFHLLRIGKWSAANSRLIEEMDLQYRMTIIEGISDKELKFCYQHSEALLFPSLTEGFGWPALEAALCGCPVISDGCGATKEIFQHGLALVTLKDARYFLEKKLDVQSQPNYLFWREQIKQLIA